MTCCKCSYRFQPYYAKRTKVWLSGIFPVRLYEKFNQRFSVRKKQTILLYNKVCWSSTQCCLQISRYSFLFDFCSKATVFPLCICICSVSLQSLETAKYCKKTVFPLFLEIKHASVFYFLLLVRHNNMNY